MQQFFRRRTDQRLYRFSDSRTRTERQQLGVGRRSKPAFQLRTLSRLSGSRKQFYLSQITALALQEVLSQYTDGIRIKWPNDIYWKDKKICGTLIENDLTGIHISRSISGTGVNLNQERFISDAPNPVSLFQITGQRYDRKEILHQLMERVAHYYTLLKNGETELIASRYQDVLYRKEGFYPYTDKDGSFRARICGIEPSGALILEDESGKRREYNV